MISSKKMNIDLMKQFNKRSILRSIRDNAPISRAEISELLNLSRPSVSALVSELIHDGWVREMQTVKGRRGRRPIPLEIHPHIHYVVGVELGAYHVTTVLCNLRGTVIQSQEFELSEHPEVSEVLNRIAGSVFTLLETAQILKKQVLGIGIAMHGPVDPERGLSIFAPNLGWHNVEVAKQLQSKTGLFTLVENDAISSGIAERWFGYGKSEANFLTLIVDYGIGAGITFDGKIYRGAHHIGGQVGHTTVNEDGPLCSCGNYGCLEVMSSEPAIVRQVQKRLRLGEPSILSALERITAGDVYYAAHQQDSLALDVIRTAARYLGVGMAHLINILDPRVIVLGGGITRAADLVIPIIRDVIQRRAMGSDAKQTPVLVSQLGKDLYPVGGATLVIERMFEDPPFTASAH